MIDIFRTFVGTPDPDAVLGIYDYLELVFSSVFAMFLISKFFETFNLLIGFNK